MLSTGSFWGRTSVRLFLLVLLVLCPLIAHDLYQTAERRRIQLEALQESLHRTAMAIAREHGARIEAGRDVLVALAEVDAVRGDDAAACSAALARLARQYDWFMGFAKVDRHGIPVCSATPAGAAVDLPAAVDIGQAFATGSLALSRVTIAPATGQPVIVLASPMRDAAGTVTGAVGVGLGLDLLAGSLDAIEIPGGAGVTVFDGDGTVLARLPAGTLRIGESIAGTPMAALVLHSPDGAGGVGQVRDPARGPSLVGFIAEPLVPGGLYVAVDLPEAIALAEQNREATQRLGILLLAITLSLAVAWFGSRALILKWVDSLSRLAARLATGELAARSDIDYGAGEVGQLIRAFDEMAAELEARDAALKASRAKYRALVQNMQDGLVLIRDGRLEFINQAFAKMIGHAADELAGRRLEDLVVPEDRPLVAERQRRRLAGEATPGPDEIALLHEDGRTRINVLMNVGLIATDDGGIAILVTLKDITRRKQAEQDLARERALLRHLIDAIPDSIFIKDAGGVYLGCNPAFAARLGITPEQVVGRTDAEVYGEAIAAFHRDKDREVLDTRALVRIEEEVALGNGTVAHVETIKVPYFGPQHQLLGVIGIGRDITARKLMELELNRLATTDSLTGVSNRRHFFLLSEREFGRARRYRRPLTVLMLDIDDFKRINDTRGHAAGDAVLVMLTLKCRELLREHDILGRLGGEEFGITLPETDLATGAAVAERLRAALAGMEVRCSTALLRLTASIGVAESTGADETFESLLNRADQALYFAKETGRNRVATTETIRDIARTTEPAD